MKISLQLKEYVDIVTAKRNEIQYQYNENNFTLRSKKIYDQQAKAVSENPELSTFYGLKGNSPLNQLNLFHVADGISGDIDHDFYEGTVSEVMTVITRHFWGCVHLQYR